MTDGASPVSGGAAEATDRLSLADWRRRLATLYAEVRALALDDPEVAHLHWRDVRERLYRDHPQSPVPPSERRRFRGRYWPYDPALRFDVTVEPLGPAAAAPAGDLVLPNSGEDALAFERVGLLIVPLAGGERPLSLYWMQSYAGGLFLPFRDATSGRETYAAGRYLIDTAKGADLGGDGASLVVDFNFAFHPSCAFDPRWACPLAPPENHLEVEIAAGERLA